MPRTLVAGETLVDLIPMKPGPLSQIDGFTHCAGGAPANVTVGLKLLGANPYFWTRLCADVFGSFLGAVLSKNDIDQSLVTSVEESKTTIAVVTYGAEGTEEFTFFGENLGTFGFETINVPVAVLDNVDWVHFGGAALAQPQGRASMMKLADFASDRNCAISFDPNVRPDLWFADDSELGRTIRDAISVTDVLFCNLEDMESVHGFPSTADQLMDRLLNCGPHTVFITLGEKGAVARSGAAAPWGESTATHDGFDVDVVDETGAGDAFTAAVIHQLKQSNSHSNLSNVVEFGNVAACHVIQRVGGMGGIPSENTFERFLNST